MEKIRVGFLPLYVLMYDEGNPAARVPREAYAEKLAGLLEEEGLSLVKAPVCRTAEEFDAAAVLFEEADVSAVITYHLAYSPSLESIEALSRLSVPIVVLDTTPDFELIRLAETRNLIGDNHGIHGVQDMCNLLKRRGRTYFVCAGHIENSSVIREAAGLCRAAAAAKAFRGMRIGSAGGVFPGMGDFQISEERLREEIGAEVEVLTPDVSEKALQAVTAEEIEAEMALDREKYRVEIVKEDCYRECVRAGLALRKWMEEKRLSACTVNFRGLKECGLPKMPFPECCKIMERGQGYAGEGDVLTAGLVGALMSAYPDTSFTEMFCPDWKEDTLLLSHMGETNPKLGAWKTLLADRKFRWTGGDTAAMYGCFRPGKAVIVNLAPMKDGFSLILCPGELRDCGLETGAYAKSNQGWFRPGMPLPAFLRAYSEAGGTHHSALVYDADMEELAAFGKMMGFEVIRLDGSAAV